MSTPVQPACLSAQPFQMLVRIARHSQIGDPEGCAAMLALLSTGRSLRAHLQRVLAGWDLSEVKFAVLVSLYALDPEPIAPADLALKSEVSRSVMNDTLEALTAETWIERLPADVAPGRRAAHIVLTDRGRALTEQAVRPFLTAVARCGEVLSPSECQAVTRVCAHLDRRLRSSTS